jgi:uncharacterized protein YcgI (DUF1989 family)
MICIIPTLRGSVRRSRLGRKDRTHSSVQVTDQDRKSLLHPRRRLLSNRVDDMLSVLGIVGGAGRSPSVLSGGAGRDHRFEVAEVGEGAGKGVQSW